MAVLPPQFNFPGAQQGIPQGIFSLIQNMSGLGGSGMPAQTPFNSASFSNTLGQLMQPRAPITPTTGPGQGFVLPPMPSVTAAPVVESRNPKLGDGTETPIMGGPAAPEELTKYLDMLKANMGDNPAQRSIRNALQKNPPEGFEWQTDERNGAPISRTLLPKKTDAKPTTATTATKK